MLLLSLLLLLLLPFVFWSKFWEDIISLLDIAGRNKQCIFLSVTFISCCCYCCSCLWSCGWGCCCSSCWFSYFEANRDRSRFSFWHNWQHINSRGIRTLDLSRKTTNAVFSDLQIPSWCGQIVLLKISNSF